MKDKGYIQVYTGNGKGKTTAAFGLSLRAVGAGYDVFIGQFIKGMHYSELDTIKKYFKNKIKIEQFGRGCFIKNEPSEEDIKKARNGLKKIEKILKNNEFDIIILDEVNIALYYNLFSTEELIKILESKNENQEIILTGRYAPEEIIKYADLVTEMKEVKHYYQKGVQAREGIEK